MSKQQSEQLRDELTLLEVDHLEHTIEEDGEYYTLSEETIDKIVSMVEAQLAERERLAKAQNDIDFVESLLDWQDQESDLDGRPIGKPYHMLSPESREVLEWQLLPGLKTNLSQLSITPQTKEEE